MYQEAQDFYLQEQEWMGKQTIQHIRERNRIAEHHKQIIGTLSQHFPEFESASNQRQSDDIDFTL